ncbi:DJ-1/PfpI family protein [Variovorax sp. J22P271]|uniref:DJ-1/PfpI family protein n=1 Tax=Variovorax davisae TaxID=3053515 RepID=UPI002574B6C6|nr:DJ-1/PfpI family protein [Variovorax sp. J22P271]MDM0036315.1 DJ-1/PfpI family protein [Variovorax sp. J22P271]
MSPGGETLRVAILAFDDVEALDLAGPYEVFTTASRMHQRDAAGMAPPFEVQCVARSRAPVRMRAGLQVLPDRSFEDPPAVDLLIVPGGVVDAAMACAATREWIARASREARITASVCTGAFLLAASGALHGETIVTTHWEDVADLRARFPALDVREGVRWVDQGRIVSSAGITAGIDMSLHLVARLAGEPLALRTARQMDFAWTKA